MSVKTFTPKQVAQALGVSESSVKRWVDNGKLPAAKTAGGHRKVPLPSVAEFIRTTGHPLSHPDVIGMVATAQRASLESACDELQQLLLAGDEPGCRELVLGFYQRAESVVDIADRLIGPVFQHIGAGWETGAVQVYQERHSCEIMMATLYELRRWLPEPQEEACLAVVATPEGDFAEVPARLIELTLLSQGSRVTLAGSGLPLEEIRFAVETHQPRLLCLSVTHLEDRNLFIDQFNQLLATPLRNSFPAIKIALGGTALSGITAEHLECDLLARKIRDLLPLQQGLTKPC